LGCALPPACSHRRIKRRHAAGIPGTTPPRARKGGRRCLMVHARPGSSTICGALGVATMVMADVFHEDMAPVELFSMIPPVRTGYVSPLSGKMLFLRPVRCRKDARAGNGLPGQPPAVGNFARRPRNRRSDRSVPVSAPARMSIHTRRPICGTQVGMPCEACPPAARGQGPSWWERRFEYVRPIAWLSGLRLLWHLRSTFLHHGFPGFILLP